MLSSMTIGYDIFVDSPAPEAAAAPEPAQPAPEQAPAPVEQPAAAAASEQSQSSGYRAKRASGGNSYGGKKIFVLFKQSIMSLSICR